MPLLSPHPLRESYQMDALSIMVSPSLFQFLKPLWSNQKALDVYEHYLGKEIRDNMLVYGIEFPLIFNAQGIDVARAPVAVHEDGSLTFAGAFPKATSVKFGYANIEYIEEYNQERLLHEHRYKNEAVYVYTCSTRRSMLGDYLEDEMSVINKIGPTTGFVTYGEFFHDGASCSNNLLNITTTYVLLNENVESAKPIEISDVDPKKKEGKDIALKALTTLVSRTSQELDEKIYYLEQFQKAVNEVAIFSVTNEKGIITDVNKNFEVISGYKKEELIGQSHNVVRHEDMPKEVFEKMWATIQQGEIWRGIVKNKNKNGKPYHVLSEISPIYNKDGSLKEYIGVRNDITELEEYKQIPITSLSMQMKNFMS
jgi:PAS domain S-box-containing protein